MLASAGTVGSERSGAAGTVVIADKAHDTDSILEGVAAVGGTAVIPARANRKRPRRLDRDLYACRNRTERFLGRIKEFRRVATRYEKRARNHLSTVLLAETCYMLRNIARKLVESTA